jgi:hypothetical protein
LDTLYRNRDLRDSLATRGLGLVARPEYRWQNIATKFRAEVENTLFTKTFKFDAGPIKEHVAVNAE